MQDAANISARTNSTAFSAVKTFRPIPSPMARLTPGALNLIGASRKEIAATIPSQKTGKINCGVACRFCHRSSGSPDGIEFGSFTAEVTAFLLPACSSVLIRSVMCG